MKKKLLLKLGAFAFLGAMGLNLQYAWADYGITERPLHVEVLAQSNESGGGGSTGSDGLWYRNDTDCSILIHGTANTELIIFGGKVSFDGKGNGILTVTGAATRCKRGGEEQCKAMTCGEFWKSVGYGSGS